MQKPTSSPIALGLLIICLGWSARSTASDAPLSLEGYSPVSYFTQGVAEQGSPQFAVEHGGRTYYLTSPEQVKIFKMDPDKYRPRYEICPYSLTQGKRVPLDPTNFKIIGETLLIFHRSEAMDGLKLWNQSPMSDDELLEQADKQFTLLRF